VNTRELNRAVRLGVRSLLLHKLRSALTTLGVLFGVSSVIAMLAIGEGASEEAQEQIRRLGSQNVILRSIKPPANSFTADARVLAYGLTHEDYDRIIATFPGVKGAIPIRELPDEVRSGDVAISPRVICTTANYLEVTGRELSSGRFLSEVDETTYANVCVLGWEVARRLFPLSDPINRRMRIGSDYFRVVGVILPRVPLSGDAPDAGVQVTGEVFIPRSTGERWWGEMLVTRRAGSFDMVEIDYHEIIVDVGEQENVLFVANACREMLARHHKQRDYEIVVPLELMLRREETKRIFNIVLGSIAGISLLVGGIGIMNVMLATVTERTREIGIRRALGAKRRHIVTQFLVETVVLSVGGGLLGICLGLIIPSLIEYFADMRTIVTPEAPILAFLISAGIGIIFGLYPAWRAANMDPVEALRHE
jgi:putative ABC transport system permease protein